MTVPDQIAMLLGRRPDGTYNVPVDTSREMRQALTLVAQLAEATGKSVDDVLSMDWIDLRQQYLFLVVRTESMLLRQYVRENRLPHAEQSLAEAMAEQGLKVLIEGGVS